MINYEADNIVFLNQSDFASVVVLPNRNIISGIFDNAHQSFGSDFDTSTTEPAITCTTSEVSDLFRNDKVIVDCVDYLVRDKEPDGTGLTVVVLKRCD